MTPPARPRAIASAIALALAAAFVAPLPALAQPEPERESLEALRQTTLALIEALVANGTLSRDKADALIGDAMKRGRNGQLAWGASPDAAAAAASAPPTVRVPYVPQVVRDQIRDELKEEITARARLERWGVPNALPEWTDRIAIEGDLRVRWQADQYHDGNATPLELLTASLSGVTRVPDLAAGNSAGLPTGNTTEDRDRLRLRARLAVNAKVADGVTAGIRLATGSSTDRVSTNQTLGNNFNRYSMLLDRAYLRLDPVDWFSFTAGRMPNPWFSTDMIWSENLNFDGAAIQIRRPASPTATWLPFFTAGYFPIRENSPPRSSRSLVGWQLGLQWEPTELMRFRVGLAQYRYNHFEGHVDPAYDPVTGPGAGYGQYEYEAGLRQRGNTLFLTNNPYEIAAGLTPDGALWGQAARFRPLALTVAAEFQQFAPYVVALSGEVVRNQGFDRDEIGARTGVWIDEGHIFGAQLRATVGAQTVRERGDWQATLGYRWLGSDAVPDDFTDSDLVLGGTNIRGWMIGLQYGLARNTAFGLRVLTGRTISSPTAQWGAGDKFGVDSLQADLNVRF